MVKSIERTVKKWDERVGVAADDYAAGVEAPTKDWETRTSASKPKYESELRRSMAEDAFTRGVKRAGTSKWKERIKAVGIERWPGGVAAAKGIFEAAMRDVLAFEDTLQKKILAMPDATAEQRIARTNAWIKGMMAFRKK